MTQSRQRAASLSLQTICGIEIGNFAKAPTPEELGAIVARMDSEDQAAFLIALGEQIHFTCAHAVKGVQYAYIRQALAAQEEHLCTGYGSEFVREINHLQ